MLKFELNLYLILLWDIIRDNPIIRRYTAGIKYKFITIRIITVNMLNKLFLFYFLTIKSISAMFKISLTNPYMLRKTVFLSELLLKCSINLFICL